MRRVSREGGCFLHFHLSGSFGFKIARAIARRCKLPIGHEIFAQILFRDIKRARRAGMRWSGTLLRKTFRLLRVLEFRVWLEQAIDQFSLLFLCARRNHLKQQYHNQQANTHGHQPVRPLSDCKEKRAPRRHQDLLAATALCRHLFQRGHHGEGDSLLQSDSS